MTPMPGDIFRNQSLYIRIDGEFGGSEGAGADCQEYADNNDRPTVAGAKADQSDNRWIDHGKRSLGPLAKSRSGATTRWPAKSFNFLVTIP
nr:hypothetical protein [Bradyrhizobium erythrophlei]